MFSKATFAAIVATIAVLEPVSALGINCRGSGLCPRASWDNQANVSVMQGLRDAMYQSKAPDSTSYKSGDHIICVSQSQKITISPGVSAGGSTGGTGATGTGSASLTVGLSGSIGNGGVCAFAQKTDLTLGDAKKLMDGLLEHGCTTCGSNPSKPGNNVDSGELTVNYVANPFCVGNCLSGTGTAGGNPTAPGAKARRWGKAGERVRDVEDVEEDDEADEADFTPDW